MLTINREVQSELMMLTMEEIIPEKSLFRKIDKAIDFTFIYEAVKELYCLDNGRPSLDPVVLFKLVFIQTLDGIKSMRKTCEKIEVDAEYRWFLGIPFGEKTPHFSTFSKNYERRFQGSDIFETIFIEIVNQAINKGLVGGEIFYTDSTHKKANANKNKHYASIVEVVKKRRIWLEEEINQERLLQGKKAYRYKDESELKTIKVSPADPESGYYHRDLKEKGYMYLDHRTVDDKSNIIVDAHITKGNVHDSQPYISRLKYLKKTFQFEIKAVALDSGYNSLDIKKYLLDKGIFGVIGYRRTGSKNSRDFKSQFKYQATNDYYYSKETGEVLVYQGLIDRNGYKTYTNQDKSLVMRRHLKVDIEEQYRANRLSIKGKELYRRRKETVERSFADSKQNHGYRYALVRGLKKNQDYTWLVCAAQNMKNIALKTVKV
ncbi:MAG: IS1182 family transposase [Balneolaceae bacterium]